MNCVFNIKNIVTENAPLTFPVHVLSFGDMSEKKSAIQNGISEIVW